MDSQDDFQFKPITKGLGFHKKVIKLKEEMEENVISKSNISRSVPPRISAQDVTRDTAQNVTDLISSIPSLEFSHEKQSVTTPHHTSKAFDRPVHTKRVEAKIKYETPTATINNQPTEELNLENQKARQAQRRKYISSNISLFSIFFDAIVVTGLTSLFCVALLIVTKVDLSLVIESASSDQATLGGLALLFFSVLELYTIIARSFFGFTLGEWALDLHMGTQSQQSSLLYPILVAWRTFITIATGIFLIPLLSLFFKSDIAGKFSGLRLYRLEE